MDSSTSSVHLASSFKMSATSTARRSKQKMTHTRGAKSRACKNENKNVEMRAANSIQFFSTPKKRLLITPCVRSQLCSRQLWHYRSLFTRPSFGSAATTQPSTSCIQQPGRAGVFFLSIKSLYKRRADSYLTNFQCHAQRNSRDAPFQGCFSISWSGTEHSSFHRMHLRLKEPHKILRTHQVSHWDVQSLRCIG